MDFYLQKQMRQYNKRYVSMDRTGFLKYVPNRNNKILTQEYLLSLDSKQTHKNNHTFIVSDNYIDLAYSYIIPNVLQCNTNYIVTDTGAIVYNKTQARLIAEGYRVRVLNFTDDTYPEQIETSSFNVSEFATTKTALFVILPETTTVYDIKARDFLQKLIPQIQEQEKQYEDGSLPRKLSLFLDLNRRLDISNLAHKMITGHKRGLYYNVFCGSYKKMREDYLTDWDVIIDSCDTIMYFGCEDMEFRKYFVGFMEHILSSEGIILLPDDVCILLIRGMHQICSPKYKSEEQPSCFKYPSITDTHYEVPQALLTKINSL